MIVDKICNHCSKVFYIPHWRKDSAKTCSTNCRQETLKGKNNTFCTQCNKHFHKKQYQKNKSKTGNFCSNECFYNFKKDYLKGENNHQYGLKGDLNSSFKGNEIISINNNLIDIKVYRPEHLNCDKDGRVLKHRLLVEENYKLFNLSYFQEYDGSFILKKGIDVHHKDNNHNNNDISNLEPLSRAEHTSLHNKQRIIKRGKYGKFIKNMTYKELEVKVLEWAKDKEILDKATPYAQALKTLEEVEELIEAVDAKTKGKTEFVNSKGKLVNTSEEVKDAVGDILVTIIIQAEMNGLKLTDCLEAAYNVISKRTGVMKDGMFVKYEN